MMPVVPQRSRVRPGVILVVLLILAILAPIAYLAWRQSVPRVQATITAPSAIGHKPSLTVALTAARGNLTGTEVRVVQGDKPVTVYKQPSALGARAEVPVTFETAALGLREGNATIEVIGPAIAEALYSTAFGLVVAIIAAIGFNYCTSRVEEMTVDMNDIASEFLDVCLREGRG